MNNIRKLKLSFLVIMAVMVNALSIPSNAAEEYTTGSRGEDGLIYQIGNSEAPVTFIEFQSQMCPYSKAFHLDVYPLLKKKYIETGEVFYISMPYVHNDDDMKAVKLVQCAGDKNYGELMDEMYRQRETWARKIKKGIITPANVERMKEIAGQYGVSQERQDKCLASELLADSLIATRRFSNLEFGVFRTPQYVINGKLYNELSWEDADYILQQLLIQQ